MVEYQNPEDAQTAIRKLNDVVLMGRPVFVREDRESDTRIGFSGGRGGTERREPVSSGSRQVFIGNVSAVNSFSIISDVHFLKAIKSYLTNIIIPTASLLCQLEGSERHVQKSWACRPS